MRVELDGDWAEIRHPNKIPHGRTMEYRDVFFEMVEAGADSLSEEDLESLEPEARKAAQKESAMALIKGGGLQVDQRLSNALVIAVVKEWSFGPVDLATLLAEVPTSDLDTILDHCDLEEYRKVLNPDFEDKTDRDPKSPTLPSAP